MLLLLCGSTCLPLIGLIRIQICVQEKELYMRRYNKFISLFVLVALLLTLVCVLLLSTRDGNIAHASTAIPDRYVSGWVLLQTGDAVNFYHGLDVRPLELNVWAALHVTKASTNFNEAMPAYQVGIYIQTANPTFIRVDNRSGADWMIQVVADD